MAVLYVRLFCNSCLLFKLSVDREANNGERCKSTSPEYLCEQRMLMMMMGRKWKEKKKMFTKELQLMKIC